MVEQWKPLPGYEDLYLVSSEGRIKSVPRYVKSKGKGRCFKPERVLKPSVTHRGYLRLSLCDKKKMSVHRAVAYAFIPNPLGLPQVNHKDGNKQNNSVSNLEWVTGSQNQKHSFSLGLQKPTFGEDNPFSKLTKQEVIKIFRLAINGGHQGHIAQKFNISKSTVSLIKLGKLWGHVTNATPC